MGYEHASLGLYPKMNKSDKVYYYNAMSHSFDIPKVDEKGEKIIRTNPVNGNPVYEGNGVPVYYLDNIRFKPWQTKFSELGYWCVYVVTKDTPKNIAQFLEDQANSSGNAIKNEKAFINFINPMLSQHMDETAALEAEKEKLRREIDEAKAEKGGLDNEIARLKKKAGIS